jgi:hypothetical protein
MSATTAVAGLLKERREWRRFFNSCCQTSALRLRSQAWRFQDELCDRGHDLSLEEAEDALFDLAQQLLPAAPAAEWSAWAELVCEDALARLQKHYANLSSEEKEALDLSRAWKRNERIVAAGLAEDRAALREAVREYEREALAGLKSIRAAAKRHGVTSPIEDRGRDDASEDNGSGNAGREVPEPERSRALTSSWNLEKEGD